MRNRLNVYWQGKRTTARFPAYLWRFAMLSTGKADVTLHDEIQDYLSRADGTDPALDKWTASDIVRDFLIREVECVLLYAGFNPGNSRAHSFGPPPDQSAAGASPTRLNSEAARGTPRPS